MIEVELPNGQVIEFPEGTPMEEINRATNDFVAGQGVTTSPESTPSIPEGSKPEFTVPSQEDQELLDREMPVSFKDRTFTPSELVSDPQAIKSIRKYMNKFHGTPAEVSDEEVVDNYLARMRKFSAGQSVVTVNELLALKQSEPEDLRVAGEAYDLFDRLEGVFSEDYTWGETFEGLGSYARAVIIDPTNLIGLGIGKAISGAGTKSAAFAMKQIAKEAAEKTLKQKLQKQVGKRTAKKILTEGAQTRAQKKAFGAASQAARVAEREALKKAAKSSAISSGLKKQAAKEVATVTGVDTALALGVDYAYQQGMLMTGNQEEYSPFQSGLTALGALGGGLAAAGLTMTNKAIGKQSQGILEAFEGYDFVKGQAKEAGKKLAQPQAFENIQKNMVKFSERVAAGKPLPEEGDLRQQFFKMLTLGDKDAGVKGLTEILIEQGVVPPRPRYVGDNITAFMSDAIQTMPKKQKDKFVKTFQDNVGRHLPEYKDATVKDIANLFSAQASVAGQVQNTSSQMKKMFNRAGINPDDGTFGDALDLLNPDVGRMKLLAQEAKDKPRTVDFFQNTLIQTIVTHPGTTALNIKGSLARSVYDTTADFVEGGLYTLIGSRGVLTGNFDDLRRGTEMMKAATRRASGARLLAPDATYEEMDNYLAIRPEVEKTLYRFLSGGVENEDIHKAFNIDKAGEVTQTVAKGLTNYKDFMQKLYFTQKQDRFFKTQNFMYYLDKNIAKHYGTSYNKLMASPDAAKIINSPEYAAVEFKAVDDTLKSVFSKAFSSRNTYSGNPIPKIATIIEDTRKIPIVGAAAPFGQFFNGTLDFMADYSFIKLAYRAVGAGEGASKEAITESIAKGTVGILSIAALSEIELGYIDRGMEAMEALDSDGTIVDLTYDFPQSFFKMMARGVAHARRDGSVPKELLVQMADTFGLAAFTRNLERTGEEVARATRTMFGDDPFQGLLDMAEVIKTDLVSAWLSGYTRPLDPLNQAVGLGKEGGPVVIDRDQGYKTLNKSFRYADQIFSDILLQLGSEEKATPTADRQRTEIGKLFGYRSVPAQSNTQRMFNSIEMPQWQAGFSTGNDKLDNKLNGFIFNYLERQATILTNRKNWDNMSVDQKRRNVRAALTLARKQARERLAASPVIEDAKLSAIDEVIRKAGSQRELKRAMEYLEMDKDLDEYNAAQIRSVLNAVDILKRQDEEAPYR